MNATCFSSFVGSHRSSASRNAMYFPPATAIPRFRGTAGRRLFSGNRTSRIRGSSNLRISARLPSVEQSSTTINSKCPYVCASTLRRLLPT